MSNTSENFIGEFENMDLSKIRDKTFIVAVNTDDYSLPKFLFRTMHGPYDFYEMIEEVGKMWLEHQHHAKVHILKKDRNERVEWLDANTIDYIEANWKDILCEFLIDDTTDKKYTCEASTVVDDEDDKKTEEK